MRDIVVVAALLGMQEMERNMGVAELGQIVTQIHAIQEFGVQTQQMASTVVHVQLGSQAMALETTAHLNDPAAGTVPATPMYSVMTPIPDSDAAIVLLVNYTDLLVI
jgi:hypothetical protein